MEGARTPSTRACRARCGSASTARARRPTRRPPAGISLELAAQRKLARKQREEFIDAAAAHAPTLLTEPPDLRAIERWLRETDRAWREGDLGSVVRAPGRSSTGA